MNKNTLYVQGYLIPTDRAKQYMAEHPRYYELMILESGNPRFKIFGALRTEYTHVPNLDLAVLFQHHFPDLCLHIQQGIYTAHI